MPQLKSGRHFGLSIEWLLKDLREGSRNAINAAIIQARIKMGTPEKLKNHLGIYYFEEGQGEPPNAPCYFSGLLVQQVLDGKSDWSQEEVEELRLWLQTERIETWVKERHQEVHKAVSEAFDGSIWNIMNDGD
ncbi:MAG TPA: hypothetical protein VNJ47_05795 [Nevskiales bacterium]|nr:hypothetical protein [Nevskiales bacterium]